jgi:hypothetical protein
LALPSELQWDWPKELRSELRMARPLVRHSVLLSELQMGLPSARLWVRSTVQLLGLPTGPPSDRSMGTGSEPQSVQLRVRQWATLSERLSETQCMHRSGLGTARAYPPRSPMSPQMPGSLQDLARAGRTLGSDILWAMPWVQQ